MKNINRFLLFCGILAPFIYVFSDIIASFFWKEYSFADQSVSELRAIGAPTRIFLLPVLYIYSLLELAFGYGVLKFSNAKKTLFTTGILIICLGLVDLAAPFFPMHFRENLQETGRTFTDTMHIILTIVTVLLIFFIIGFGSVLNGSKFRLYSYLTIVILLGGGIWAALDAQRIETNLPTPWIGIRERINIYGYMLWIILFAGILFIKGNKNILIRNKNLKNFEAC